MAEEKMKAIGVGILGLGTVGSGVYELLTRNGKLISLKSGVEIRVVKAADRDVSRKDALGIPDGIYTDSAEDVTDDPDVDIVIELIGGTGVARELSLRALSHGKHLVTANKALLAEYGSILYDEVLKNGIEFGYEASVGGGIPIIKTIRESLVGNRIDRIVGILNGTTNFILTKMTREGLDFKEALSIAQELGFAESDPTLDISGGDARHKITILASLAFKTLIDISSVYVEGIESIHERDMEYADELGFVLKLLAIAERNDGGVFVRVHPAFIQKDNPLAAVCWEDNAVMVYSDYLGKSMYYGKGAGKKPTASAVVADIVQIALRIKDTHKYNRSDYSFFEGLNVLPFDQAVSRYYFRFNALDRPGILSRIAGILGEHRISIASVIQKETEEEHEHVPLIMITHDAVEKDVQAAIEKINGLSDVDGMTTIIRVIEEDPNG